MGRVILLNALPITAFQTPVTLRIEEITPMRLQQIISQHEIVNYIRHESTVRLLNQLLGVNLQPGGGLYRYEAGDQLIVVVLRSPQRGQQDVAVSAPEDIAIYRVDVISQ
jgi:hypothetical protein